VAAAVTVVVMVVVMVVVVGVLVKVVRRGVVVVVVALIGELKYKESTQQGKSTHRRSLLCHYFFPVLHVRHV